MERRCGKLGVYLSALAGRGSAAFLVLVMVRICCP